MNPNYFYSKYKYPCDCPECHCPSAGGRQYTFRYVNSGFVYYDVPKCGSSTIRRTLFGKDEKHSMNWLLAPSKKRFSFSFVRNPWDRAVSNWKMFTTQDFRVRQLESMGGSKDMDLGQFLRFAMRNKNHHWLPQRLYVPTHVNFLGRLETFDDDFSTVLDIIGIEAEIKHLNKTDRKGYREYFDGDTRRLVSRMYGMDIHLFGYDY